MPELPEVETVRKKLLSKLKNKKIINIKILYNNIFENQDIEKITEEIKNQTINDINRIGKWLIYDLDDYYLLSHLRMEGKYIYRNIISENNTENKRKPPFPQKKKGKPLLCPAAESFSFAPAAGQSGLFGEKKP